MAGEVNFLRASVNLDNLYANKVDKKVLTQIKEMSANGFTQAELDKIKAMGVDTAPLTANFEPTEEANAADKLMTATGRTNAGVSDAVMATKIAELKEKYNAAAGGGDKYSMGNPQLVAFQKAINDGVIADLGAAGFSKSQIVDVVNSVFPSIGIAATANGGYTCPYGHDAEAKALYNKFTSELQAAAGTSPEIQALEKEITALNFQIISNNNQIRSLKATIENLQQEVERMIDQAIQDSEEIAEEQKSEAQSIVASELRNYTNANGEMSYEQFESNLSGKLDALSADGDTRMSAVVRDMLRAESKMNTLKAYVSQMGSLIKENASLSESVKMKVADLDALRETIADTEDPDCQKCDPIGFTAGDARYDFFVDKDNDGKLSNEKEFLGADDGWAEMANLDTNGDGKVTKDEMAGLKMVVTNADGTQSIEDAANLFKDGDAINLNSYKSMNQDMSNGNTLLGTFDLTFNGQEVKDGYNTLDKISWLDDNYDFSDKANGINRHAKDEYNKELQNKEDFSADLEAFEAKIEELDAKFVTAWNNLGIEREVLKSDIDAIGRIEGNATAQKIDENFKKIAKNKEEKEAIAQEAAANEEARVQEEAAAKVETENAAEEAKKKKVTPQQELA